MSSFNRVHRHVLMTSITFAALTGSGTAAAQSTPGSSAASVQTPGPAQDPSSPESDQRSAAGTDIQDIVVTAQRREQRGNDVGIAINVLSGDELARAGIKQVVDLASQTTNVQIKNTLGNSVPNVTIRGIGLNDYASNNNPAAGIYVDNVYLVSPAMLSFGMFDVDRVEVLKGPQGDLYGRNTTAGAVNVITRRPSSKTAFEMQGGFGSYQNFHLNGAAGGALTSTLNGRFAFTTEQQRSGFQTNYVTGGKIGRINRTAARLQLEWTPTEALNLLLNGHAGADRSDQALYKVENTLTTEEDRFADRPRVAGASNAPQVDLQSYGASLTVDLKLADSLNLASITAYEKFKRTDVGDQDGTGLRQLDSTFRNDIDQVSEELRLSFNREGMNIVGGGYYSHDRIATRDSYDAVDLLPLLGLPGNSGIGNTYRQRTDAYAAFLHGEWTFLPRLTVIAGVRYTDESKTFDNATTFIVTNAGQQANVFPPVSRDYSTSKVSGKVGLNYKLAEQSLLYASVSRGFKSGGFQGQLTFDPSVYSPFTDENLTAYEIGLKTRLLSNLQVNLAAFDYEYSDAQFYGPLFDSPVGVLFGITNVGDARVRGVEGDALWRPTKGLDLRLGAGYIDTEVTRSIVPGVAQGSRLPNAPELTINGSVRYELQIAEDRTVDLNLSGNYQSRVAFDIVRNPPEALQGGYFLANGEVGISLGERARLSVFGKNILNRLYRTQALFTSVGWSYQYGAPRTVGLNLSYKM